MGADQSKESRQAAAPVHAATDPSRPLSPSAVARWILVDASGVVGDGFSSDALERASRHLLSPRDGAVLRVRRALCRDGADARDQGDVGSRWAAAGWSVTCYTSSSAVPALRRELLALMLQPDAADSKFTRVAVIVVGQWSVAMELMEDLEELVRLDWHVEICCGAALKPAERLEMRALQKAHGRRLDVTPLFPEAQASDHENKRSVGDRINAPAAATAPPSSRADAVVHAEQRGGTAGVKKTATTAAAGAQACAPPARVLSKRLLQIEALANAYKPKGGERFIFMDADHTLFSLRCASQLHAAVGAKSANDLRVNFPALTTRVRGQRAGQVAPVVRQLHAYFSGALWLLSRQLLARGWRVHEQTSDEDSMLLKALVDTLETARSSASSASRTLVLVTGTTKYKKANSSMCGILERFLAAGWAIEIHAWSHAVSETYVSLMKSRPNDVVVCPLDAGDVQSLLFDRASAETATATATASRPAKSLPTEAPDFAAITCPVTGDVLTDSVFLLCCDRSVAQGAARGRETCPLCGSKPFETRPNHTLNQVVGVLVSRQLHGKAEEEPADKGDARAQALQAPQNSSSERPTAPVAPATSSSTSKQWICEPCNVEFVSQSVLENHQDNHLPCPVASCKFQALKTAMAKHKVVKAHVVSCHQGLDPKLVVYPNGYTCERCGNSFPLKSHVGLLPVMKVVCISDTHGLHEELLAATGIPDGDVLIHAGDFTDTGDRDEVLAFNAFLARLPHRYKLVVAGNHESTFDRAFYPAHWQQYGHRQAYDPDEVRALLTNALYLEDQAVVIDGFLFYGSPWQPEFCSWAFNLPRGPQLLDKWQRIPDAVDVLVTHTPPLGRGDQVGHLRVGCADLLREVQSRIRPQFHVFGHVHEGYGSSSDGVTTFLNASSCTHEYEAVNPPMVLDLRTPRTACIPADLTARWRYEVLLHEQLRVCSQKPAFVPKPLAARLHRAAGVVSAPAECIDPHSPSDAHPHGARKASLREFRVDGTTAALLFESTLKLRPVVGEQTRALRYLFHQGFRHGAPGAAAVGTAEDGSVLARGHLEDDGLDAVHVEDGDEIDDVADEAANADGQASESQRRRRRRTRSEDRRPSLTRRVTFAVLKEVLDTRPSDPLIPVDAQAKALNGQDAASTEKPIARRRRPDKSLRRREAVARLAPMMEEPEDGKEPEAKEPDRKEPDPPTVPVDCMLCKYKVAGHVHATDAAPSKPSAPSATGSKPENDGSAAPEPTAQLQQPSVLAVVPPAPAVDCILCKYKVAGHIRFFLLQNRQGKTRLSKWYVPPPDDQGKTRLEGEIHRLVVGRDAKHTNFIEFRSYKLIYRRYAGLFFILGVDVNANELLCLETIHLFVELLDQQFSNVCELDIVFNFNKVYSMLDEYILGGEVQETSKREMLERIRELEKLE
ncbi:hypothetical protein P43SY_000857 [Pythium insidiosum]|uniref:AP-2 complex subunit sigma n=1 Tax=Pythium insidiosum TaxID=114742 RepID=A0AAD5Q3T1_PYTIN|nr:hypothetical protein P43SY_000857 [Pythium insidiosum]